MSVLQGLDISGVKIVVQYGIPRDIPNALQRGGRGGRSTEDPAIFLIMYEPWALEIDLSDVPKAFANDPDSPVVEELTAYSNKMDRTGYAMLFIIQAFWFCLRAYFAEYLGDNSDDGMQYLVIPVQIKIHLQ